MHARLGHDEVGAPLPARVGSPWTVTVRPAWPDAPLIAMFSGLLQKAEPKEDAPPEAIEYVWYVGSEEQTFGAFSIPREGFRIGCWEATPKGPCLTVHARGIMLALFPRADEEE